MSRPATLIPGGSAVPRRTMHAGIGVAAPVCCPPPGDCLLFRPDGFPQATLHLPSGDVILQIPSNDAKGNVRASKPHRAVMEALGAEAEQGR
jgi:hypothetical protein